MFNEKVELLIDGVWCQGSEGETLSLLNPATGAEIATIPCASFGDLDRALTASQRAFEEWKQLTAAQRWTLLSKAADLLDTRKPEIAKVLTQENGKSLQEATGEIQFCVDAIRWYAEEGKRAYGRIIPARNPLVRQSVLKEPVGPALGFAAWNFPAGNVSLKIAGALAAGCSIIIKPSNETPATAVSIVRCFQDAGIPAGVIGLVFGPPGPISEYLISSSIPKKVSLTGSTPVGKLLQKLAAETLKRCTMELGGHAPVLVFEDANLERALDQLVAAKFKNAGQVCTSPTRFFIHRSIYEKFVKGFVERTERLVIGNGLDNGVVMGPLITERRLDNMDALVADSVAKGARVLTGGGRLDREGFFFAPTVICDVPDDALIMNDEPFGPVAPLTVFDTFEEVIKRANALPYALAAYIFTRDGTTAARASQAVEAGVVGINHMSVHEAETPFGGFNESGYGQESGLEGLDAYLRIKMVADAQV
ncbi:NAD-dependent succinate-semialdehyde dehydrogenase [Pseudomonas syringae]|nr:NAD-dependent succinate-semialdehyde dehydrogenase [Pseudomonas syringae pv. syringae]TRN92106.1 NAD-dependent succinate-semialdehyde dehydrogenase [Pseudomonas syringae]